MNIASRLRNIQWNSSRLVLFNLQRYCPTRLRCCCLKQSRRERLFHDRFY